MFQSRLFLLSATLLLLTPIFVQSDPVDNRKNEVVVKKGAKEVDPKGFLGDSAAAKVADPQHVNIKYGGSGKGPLKGKSGVAGADRAPDNAILTATESSGSKAKVNDDKSKKTADISTSGNDNIKTNVADPKNAVADVKTGKNKNAKVKANRINNDQVLVNQEGDKNVYKVSGIANGNKDQNDILVENANKPGVQQAEKSVKKAPDGQISHLGAQEANLADKNLPIGDTNKVLVDKSASAKGSQSKITLGKSVGISHGVDSNNKFGSIGGDCSTTTSETQAQPCTAAGDQDDLSNNGYKVYDDIKWEYPPEKTDASGNPTYSFPGCFIAKAGIQIPPGVDKKDLGIQIVAYNQIVGTMQCDASTECQDKSTANQPAPPCFHCNYCENPSGTKKIDYGLNSDSNFCQITGGQRFNLQWKVCPPKETNGKFKAFNKQLIGGEKHEGDVDMVIKIFHREKGNGAAPAAGPKTNCEGIQAILNAQKCLGITSPVSNPNGLSWVLKACRRATMSYSARCGKLGSVGSDNQAGNNPLSGGNPFGGKGGGGNALGGLLGRK